MFAQKKELSQARTYIKSKKNYDKAEQLMTTLLRDSVNRDNKRIYITWLEAVKGQYDQANEKLYLKQKQDTTAFFSLTERMFTIAETLDSLDARPDKKVRIRPEHRQKNAAMLNTYRPNLYNAGTFFIRKNKWKEAAEYLTTYIDCARQPLFAEYNYDSTDRRLPDAAYWVTYCGYKQHDAATTLRYQPLALNDTAYNDFILQFTAEAYLWRGDTAKYIETLEEGFRRFPQFNYFFPRLIDILTNTGQDSKALAVADSALQVCDSCEIFLFAKSSVLLRMERWQESTTYSEKLIHQNDSLPEAYFNAGTAFLKMAEAVNKKEQRNLFRTYSQKARTYMEYYRRLKPDEKKKWAPALYRIYLNLNLGRQFDEIDRLLKEI